MGKFGYISLGSIAPYYFKFFFFLTVFLVGWRRGTCSHTHAVACMWRTLSGISHILPCMSCDLESLVPHCVHQLIWLISFRLLPCLGLPFHLKMARATGVFSPMGLHGFWGSKAGPHDYMTCALFLPTELSLQILLTILKQTPLAPGHACLPSSSLCFGNTSLALISGWPCWASSPS